MRSDNGTNFVGAIKSFNKPSKTWIIIKYDSICKDTEPIG